MFNQDATNLPQSSINIQENTPINSTLDSNNVIIKAGNSHPFIKVTEEELKMIQSYRLNRSLDMTEYIPRKETEKEITRLDKDIAEIKDSIQKIETKMNSFVTKDYLNNEFKPALLNEIKVYLSNESKTTRKWLIGIVLTIIGLLISISTFIMKFL